MVKVKKKLLTQIRINSDKNLCRVLGSSNFSLQLGSCVPAPIVELNIHLPGLTGQVYHLQSLSPKLLVLRFYVMIQ